ncbi:hypothetical protein AAHC03_012882 [Spirometra sp. Aus1]
MTRVPCLLLLLLLCAVLASGYTTSPRKQRPHEGYKAHKQAPITNKGDLHFKDCREQICHQGLYDGYNCRAGYCDYVCDHMACYESSRVKKTFAKTNSSQKANWNWRHGGASKGRSQFKGRSKFGNKVDFSGCASEYCKSGDYEGYDCKNGHCGYVCKGADCYLD